MISATFMTYLSAVAILITATVLMLWQILSAPDRPNYPTSGKFKRAMMFLLVVMLYGRGSELIFALSGPSPTLSTPFQAAASFAMCALFISFLVDHCRNWLPARTHRNIQRLYRIARCSPRGLRHARQRASNGCSIPSTDAAGAALVTLALQGANVAGPNEGPEAFTQH